MRFDVLIKPFFKTDAMRAASFDEERLLALLKKPLVRDDKDQAPLWVFGKPSHAYVVSSCDSNAARACYENIEEYTAVVLDYDSGRTIESFVNEFKDRFKFYLYTSFNHGYKPTPRFRVIIPLATPINMHYLDGGGFRRIMCRMFSDIDPTCFDRGHFQAVPCVRIDGDPHYFYYVNETEKFLNITREDILAEDRELERLRNQIRMFGEASRELNYRLYGRRIDDDVERITRNKMKWAQDYIDKNCVQGNRDNCCFRVLSYLRDNGLLANAWELDVPADFQKQWEAKLARFSM